MILLDTNVLSALMRPTPDQQVGEWLDGMPRESVWTTTVTVFELRFGIEILPAGQKRRQLEAGFERLVGEALAHRIVPFDTSAATAAAAIAATRRVSGRPAEIRDLQIAGIAAARKATLATRNVKDFEGAGVTLMNPWSTP